MMHPNPRDYPVHFTTLKHIARSPAHYLEALLRGIANTRPLARGRLVHSVTLGGPSFLVWEGTRRGKDWDAFREANEGQEIVTRAEVDEAHRIAEAVRSDPVAGPLLEGEREKPVEWTMLGRRCATRGIDVLGATFIADLKTTRNAEPGWFRRECLKLGYHAQLAFYQDAAASIGRRVPDAYIIGVESSPPYAVTVVRLTPRALDEGRKLARLWLERLLVCEDVNAWPGYVQSAIELDVVVDAPFTVTIDGEEVAA